MLEANVQKLGEIMFAPDATFDLCVLKDLIEKGRILLNSDTQNCFVVQLNNDN